MAKYFVEVYKDESPKICCSDMDLQTGEAVVLRDELCSEVGIVLGEAPTKLPDTDYEVTRKATDRDEESFREGAAGKKDFFQICKKEIRKLNLQMKLIDVRIGLDGNSLIVLFTAEERVDFRELVKVLSQKIQRSVRMHQIGSRDEARRLGGCGVCGRSLCCLRSQGNLPSISIDMARSQQIAHRGSERISGLCGRLMCCLSYEACQYKEMLQGMPELHAKVRTPHGIGDVIELNALTQEIKVRCEDGKIITCARSDIS